MKDRLKQLRKTLDLKQRDIAERLGVNVGLIGAWECGKQAIPKTRIYQLCKEYNVNRTWLETGEGEMFEPKVEPDVDEIKRQFVEAIIKQLTDDQRQVIYDAVMNEAEREKEAAEKK